MKYLSQTINKLGDRTFFPLMDLHHEWTNEGNRTLKVINKLIATLVKYLSQTINKLGDRTFRKYIKLSASYIKHTDYKYRLIVFL